MKIRSVLAFSAIAALAIAASPAQAQTDWTGFYLGANGGYGWSDAHSSATPFGATAIGDFTPQSLRTTARGAVFGGQLGYNWQIVQNWLIGAEADFDGSGMSGAKQTVFPSLGGPVFSNDSYSQTDTINWLASIRARLGYTWGPALLYVTGGGAFENVTRQQQTSAEIAPGTFGETATSTNSHTNIGGVGGAGVEWMVAPGWSVRGEDLVYVFGGGNRSTLAYPICATPNCGTNVSSNNHIVNVFRIGLNYQFGQAAAFAPSTMPTFAALGSPSLVNWTGFYVGGNGGYGWSDSRGTASPVGTTAVGDFGPHTLNTDADGAVFGAQLGYNWQVAQSWVFGGEVDFDGSGISGSKQSTFASIFNSNVDNSFSQTDNINWLSSVRARLGYSFGAELAYVTGGVAFENITRTQQVSAEVAPAVFGETATSTNTNTNIGGVVGAGLEWMVAPGWSVRAEDLVYLMGQNNNSSLTFPSCAVPGCGANVSSNNNVLNVFRVGFNYHFGAPVAPPATPVAAPVVPPPAAVAPSQQMFIVFFEFDKSALTPDGAKVVAAAADAFKNGKSGIAIAGYTDLAGTQTYNLALSHRRADAVKAALVKDGVPASAIGESWHGKENPRVPTADGVREPQNRRVEITM